MNQDGRNQNLKSKNRIPITLLTIPYPNALEEISKDMEKGCSYVNLSSFPSSMTVSVMITSKMLVASPTL